MEQLRQLREYLTKLASGGLCVALSGGVDSAVLLKAACEVAPENTHAVTLFTPFHSAIEPKQAAILATYCGAVHKVVELEEMPAEVLENPPDRCYLCKKTIFYHIQEYARKKELLHVLDGTNADDLTRYRPGIRALRELDIRSPLAELGFTKAEVRQMAAAMGLAVAGKPSSPCLATRFPYNTPIDPRQLNRVERIEAAVKTFGPQIVRARVHGDTIRLEVRPEDFTLVVAHHRELVRFVEDEGFLCLTLDLAGYQSGSMDRLYFSEDNPLSLPDDDLT